jgi:hypothetical protein
LLAVFLVMASGQRMRIMARGSGTVVSAALREG